MSFWGQGHIYLYQCKGLAVMVVVSKYEVNSFTNKKVVVNVKVTCNITYFFTLM